MKLLILDDYAKISDFAAAYLCKRINEVKPTAERPFVLGLPTGSSPLGMYKKLVELYRSGKVSFQHVITFNMDEYVGIPEEHSQSYHFFMFDNFFKHIDIDPANVHIPNGNASDFKRECQEYEEKIRKAGGIELFVGGLGSDGHVAFNMPGSSLASRTRVQALNNETILVNSRFFKGDKNQVPKEALTVGVGTVMDAREVLLLVSGSNKALALHKSIEKGISHMWTASALQLHPNAFWVVDEDSTLELKVHTYKHFKAQLPNYLTLIQ